MQGLGAELVFPSFLYRNWRRPRRAPRGRGRGPRLALNDLVLWYAGRRAAFAIVYLVVDLVGGAVVAGLLAWLAVRGLAATGALDRFARGRELRAV